MTKIKSKLEQMPVLISALAIGCLEIVFSVIAIAQSGGVTYYRDYNGITNEAHIGARLWLVTAAVALVLVIVAFISDKHRLHGVMSIVTPMAVLIYFGCVYQTFIRPSEAIHHYITITAGIVALVMALLSVQVGQYITANENRQRVLQGALLLLNTFILASFVAGAAYWGSFTVAEFLKLGIIFFSAIASVPLAENHKLRMGFYYTIAGAVITQIVLHSIGDALLIAILGLAIAFTYDRKLAIIVSAAGSAVVACGACLLVKFKPDFYAAQRLVSFMNFYAEDNDASHQMRRALYVLLRSGIWGKGTDNNLYTSNLYAASNDFAFDGFVSLFGIGAGFVLVGLVLMLALGVRQPKSTSGNSARREAFGNFAGILILVNTIVALGGNTFIMPVTGLCYPLLSSGGSNVCLVSMLAGCTLANRLPNVLPDRIAKPVANGVCLALSKVSAVAIGIVKKMKRAGKDLVETIKSNHDHEEVIDYEV